MPLSARTLMPMSGRFVGTATVESPCDQEAMSVSNIKMLFVVAAVAVGMLLMLLVGLLIRPDDGKKPTGGPALQLRLEDRTTPYADVLVRGSIKGTDVAR
jgi:hypothetical protein